MLRGFKENGKKAVCPSRRQFDVIKLSVALLDFINGRCLSNKYVFSLRLIIFYEAKNVTATISYFSEVPSSILL